MTAITHALICANGDPNDGLMVSRALRALPPTALIIAADGGARVARWYGLRPQIVIGDLDSIQHGDLAALERGGAQVLRYPPEKDQTDLELALTYAAERGATWIRVLGGIGDRLDQTLANVYLLGAPALAGRDVRLAAGRQEAWLIGAGQHPIAGAVGDTVSLLPVAGPAIGVTTDGLYYRLIAETLTYHQARGVSNVLSQPTAAITLTGGVLLVVHTAGRA